MAARLNWVVPAEEPSRSRPGLDRQLDTVISGYRASHELAARVVELEGQLAARASGVETPAAAIEPAPTLVPANGPPPRARQLSEASFVAGSVALGFGDAFFDAANEELRRCARLDFSVGGRIEPAGCAAQGPLLGAAAVGRRALGIPVLSAEVAA